MARYNADGTLDPTFGLGTGGTVITDFGQGADIANALYIGTELQQPGIVLAGRRRAAHTATSPWRVYTLDGRPATTFGVDGLQTIDISSGDDEAFALLRSRTVV